MSQNNENDFNEPEKISHGRKFSLSSLGFSFHFRERPRTPLQQHHTHNNEVIGSNTGQSNRNCGGEKKEHRRRTNFMNSSILALAGKSSQIDRVPQDIGLDNANENISQKLTFSSAMEEEGKHLALTRNKTTDSPADLDHAAISPRKPFAKLYEEYLIRTSELDPSQHQITISTIREFFLHAQICSLMEDLCDDDQCTNTTRFDFNILCGLSRFDLYNLHQTMSLSNTTESHCSILGTMLQCADDLVVESYHVAASYGASSEVTIFSSQRYRQFIACYRGSQEQQANPSMGCKANHQKKHEILCIHQGHPIPVYPSFFDEYFVGSMEEKVFSLLNKLSAKDPFCDVTFTGHGFGGALSNIAALRFAAAYPAMTVSCHVFGTPRIGGFPFRLLANSLPNLRIIRIENEFDPYVCIPDNCVHAGHSITISADKENRIQRSTNTNNDPTSFLKALAYRFDERRPIKSFSRVQKQSKFMKHEHEIRSYVDSLGHFTSPGRQWAASFVGEEGKGISGIDGEVRCVV